VETVVNIGADLESSQQAADLECQQIQCYSTIGLHPHESSRLTDETSIHQQVENLEQIYHSHLQKIVGVGEIGLDYHFEGNEDYTPSSLTQKDLIQLQKKLFLTQIELARKLNLPIVIHSREGRSTDSGSSTWEDIFVPELKNTRGVFHSFTGNLEQAQKVLNLGYYLGFTCVVTYPKNDSLRQVIAAVPLERILTETDCPFLPPQTMRGQRNEPANVIEVAKTIAAVKGISLETVAEVTTQNARHLFKIDKIK
jgi:TatD DNase family protein